MGFRAEAAGFSSLSTIGAVSYPDYEELTHFAAAGAVTERIRFMSNVMIAPARSTAELERDVMGGWRPCASTSSSTTPR